MALTVKTRIATGIGVLFSLMAIVSVLALIAINVLSSNTENLLSTNYGTIRHCNEMRQALDEMQRGRDALADFETALAAQEANITESGEREATAGLRRGFELLKKEGASRVLADSINSQLYRISRLNGEALERKNGAALATAGKAKLWLSMLITLVLVAGLSLSYNLPGIVAAPVRKLTEGIREIGKGNYSARIHLNNRDDEFGQMAEAFNRMAGRLHDWENSSLARILFEKRRVDSIINQMEDAVVGTDGERRMLFINKAASELYGLDADAIAGRPAGEVAAGNELLQTVLNRSSSRGALKVVSQGREEFFMLTHKAVHAEGKSLGDVYTLKNVTHFKELDLSKTALLATISHELKTPISSIKMSVKLLGDERIGALNSEQLEMVGSITDDAERLLRLTAELLNMTQIETGKIQLRLQAVSPGVIVAEAVAAVAVQAQARGIGIRQSLPADLPRIQADAGKTALVLINLLSNAIRHSPEGGAILLRAERAGATVLFSVQDSGAGVEPQYRGRIFERYFRVPDSGSKGGTGLGLAIAREFIEAQGGEIGMAGETGGGSRFYFSLPLA